MAIEWLLSGYWVANEWLLSGYEMATDWRGPGWKSWAHSKLHRGKSGRIVHQRLSQSGLKCSTGRQRTMHFAASSRWVSGSAQNLLALRVPLKTLGPQCSLRSRNQVALKAAAHTTASVFFGLHSLMLKSTHLFSRGKRVHEIKQSKCMKMVKDQLLQTVEGQNLAPLDTQASQGWQSSTTPLAPPLLILLVC